MEIKLAKTAGFCFGVNRAVDMLYKMVGDGEKVCTLGPIIHNPQVIEDLESKGVKIISDENDVPQDTKRLKSSATILALEYSSSVQSPV